ncbi:MAG: FkbM family methyltransferase [Planctomycetota bacterium]|nr:FkbM family methyltransferase [Planctomycetota bacterium]
MIDFSLTQAPAVPDLLRVGRPGDGGYAVPQSMLGACDGVIGAGVRDDWTFEAAARALMPRCACLHLYDPTTHARQLWWRALKTLHKCVAHAATLDGTRLREDLHRLLAPLRYARLRRDGITHFKEWVGGNAGLPMSTLISRAQKDGSKSLLLKIDIEGAEFNLLTGVDGWASAVPMIVVEFHDLDRKADQFNRVLRELAPWFVPAHIHGNSGRGLLPCGFPTVAELTLARRDLLPQPVQCVTHDYPRPGLDQPNERGAQSLVFRA